MTFVLPKTSVVLALAYGLGAALASLALLVVLTMR
ncbi:hypothetical protein HDA40_000042 [Hamadaea flava]|nr:hypothetical protein [Hamadaea flava]